MNGNTEVTCNEQTLLDTPTFSLRLMACSGHRGSESQVDFSDTLWAVLLPGDSHWAFM
jgi:hypothetical protein